MIHLLEYIFEAAFGSSEWSKHNFKYATAVIYDLINGNPVYIAENGKKSNVQVETNDAVVSALKELCINPEATIVNDLKLKSDITLDDFNKAFVDNIPTAFKNTWTRIFKGSYSKVFHSGDGGMEFEQDLCKGLQECFMNNGQSSYHYAVILYDKLIKRHPKTFEKISNALKADKKSTIADFIFVSGKGSTSRNKFNQIINVDTFEVNIDKKFDVDAKTENNVNNVLQQSGKIIADITITPDGKKFDKSDVFHINPDDIYISCKDGFAQFSAISMQTPFYGASPKNNPNTDLIDSYNNGETYQQYAKKNTTNVKAFNNLCDFMCINPEEVYNYFSHPEDEREKEILLNTSAESDGNIIGTLIHLLIGGNYWYANSDSDPVFINDDIDSDEFLFKPNSKCRLNPKQIVLTGDFVNSKIPSNETRVEIKFRSSDSSATYPFRLFVVPKDKKLINRLFG